MNRKSIISQIEAEVKKQFSGEGTGHDFWHIDSVRKIALKIGRQEGADLFIVELATLLHDIADHKFHDGDLAIGGKVARKMLLKFQVDPSATDHISNIVDNISFKGAADKSEVKSIEGKVVQDADRLDALGAIGIGRAFAIGGHFGRPIYDPDKKPNLNLTKEEYVKRKADTINHFYEKLLLLKDRMNTETGKQMAEERHKFTEEYLERFYKEWDGEE